MLFYPENKMGISFSFSFEKSFRYILISHYQIHIYFVYVPLRHQENIFMSILSKHQYTGKVSVSIVIKEAVTN